MARAANAALGDGLWSIALGFVGEVVVADGEAVLGVVGGTAEVVAPGEADGSDFTLGGEGEDVGGVEEKVLAEVSCGAGFLAEVVVSDEEEGGLGVVGDVADDAAELCGHVYAAEWHEVVDVVDDDELGLELLNKCLDVAVDGVDVLALGAEDVEADEMEVFLGENAEGAPSYLLGDVDMDGNITINDVTRLIDYLLNTDAIEIDINAADCLTDGVISITDVTALIDYLLSGNW